MSHDMDRLVDSQMQGVQDALEPFVLETHYWWTI